MEKSVVLFDGVCNLCSGAVKFIIQRDPGSRFVFASLQSAAGARVLSERGLAEPLGDSIVLVDEAGVHTRSTAVLRIAAGLTFPWKLARIGALLPRGLRDAVYGLVARSRYRVFGKQATCMRPTPELAARFLDAAEGPAG